MTQFEFPSQAQVDAGIARGRRMQSAAFVSFFSSVAAMFTSGSQSPAHTTYGNAAR